MLPFVNVAPLALSRILHTICKRLLLEGKNAKKKRLFLALVLPKFFVRKCPKARYDTLNIDYFSRSYGCKDDARCVFIALVDQSIAVAYNYSTHAGTIRWCID